MFWGSFLYSYATVAITYSLSALQRPNDNGPFYVSEIMNSRLDTVPEFLGRWFMWLMIPPLVFGSLRFRCKLSSVKATPLPVGSVLTIISGLDARVWNGLPPDTIWKYAHGASTAVVMISATSTFYWLGYTRLSYLFAGVTFVYGTAFVAVYDFANTRADLPFVIAEYVFLSVGWLVIYVGRRDTHHCPLGHRSHCSPSMNA